MGRATEPSFASVTTDPLPRRLRTALRQVADPVRAEGARAYMKSAMPFLGVDARTLRATCRATFAGLRWPQAGAWMRDVRGLWRGAKYREERYAAIELTGHRAARAFQTPEALPLYEEMIVTGAWWDLVDGIATHRIGDLLRAHEKTMRRTMLAWARDDDLWKRRTAILCQVRFKEATDLGLLYACIEPSLGRPEFFLRKAIGWALRSYAWTDPDEVVRYVAGNAERLSPLSRREALKNVRQ